MDEPTAPSIELIEDLQDEVLRHLSGRLGAESFLSLLAVVAGRRGLPGSADQASRDRSLSNEQRRDFMLLFAGLAEAVWRLIGTGHVVPVSGASYVPVPTTYQLRNERSSGPSVDHPQLELEVPTKVRLSTLGREWLSSGTHVLRNPDLYLADLPVVKARVRSCLHEAVESFRRGLPLACVILLGAASEAAWVEVGTAVATRLGDHALATLLAGDDGAAKKQAAVLSAMETALGSPRKARTAVGAATEMHPDQLRFLAQFFAELRNYAAHEDVPPLPVDMTIAGTILYQAHDYFAALYRLPTALP
ncbi:MAG: hypothetical protein ACC726_07475 [Chloroflexota bacterium]